MKKFLAAVALTAALSTTASAQYVYGYSNGNGADAFLTLNGSTTVGADLLGWCSSSAFCNGRFSQNNYLVGLGGYRDWFQFRIPEIGAITSATLTLNTYTVDGGPWLVSFFDIVDVAALGTDSFASYLDQGNGYLYGSRTYTTADNSSFQTLNLSAAALYNLNASQGQDFGIGGILGEGDPTEFNTAPEPGSLALIGTGLLAFVGYKRRRAA